MINDRPNYWGTPLGDWYDKNLGPEGLAKQIVAKSCAIPTCANPTTEEYCDKHQLEINLSRQNWEDWKGEQLSLDSYFIPYEEL